MRLNQVSIEELSAMPDADPPKEIYETYVPSPSEKARGKWAAVCELVDDAGYPDLESPFHIIPTFGAHHLVHGNCWCGPRQSTEPGGNGYLYWTHEASQ